MALRVLLAVDGSECSLALVRCWSRWQETPEHSLSALLLTAVPPPPHAYAPPFAEPGLIEARLLEWGAERLQAAIQCMSETSLLWESAIQVGQPASELVAAADQWHADLIALGMRGTNPLRRLLIGSTALRVAHTSRAPLWLMPSEGRCPPALGRRLRILVAVDGSTHALDAVGWAARSGHRFGDFSLDIVCVQPDQAILQPLISGSALPESHWSRQIGQAALDQACAHAAQFGAKATAELRHGEAIEQICHHAHAIEADVVVVGTRGLGTIGQSILGSVSCGLLQVADRPLIIVPSSVNHPVQVDQSL